MNLWDCSCLDCSFTPFTKVHNQRSQSSEISQLKQHVLLSSPPPPLIIAHFAIHSHTPRWLSVASNSQCQWDLSITSRQNKNFCGHSTKVYFLFPHYVLKIQNRSIIIKIQISISVKWNEPPSCNNMLQHGGVLKSLYFEYLQWHYKKYRINALAIILHLDNLFVHIETAESGVVAMNKK